MALNGFLSLDPSNEVNFPLPSTNLISAIECPLNLNNYIYKIQENL